MAWTTPRTWTDTEVVTAAMMNSHLRDNQAILKVTRDDAGRISGLSSTTLADLSAANLTGLAFAGQGNSYTSRTQFRGSSRVVLPVGADLWTGTKGVDARGVWVEGDYFHHIASDATTEWRYLGTFVSTPAGAVPGSVWVEGDELHYVDADGDERSCRTTQTGHTDAVALAGSAWVETYVHWIRETAGGREQVGHADVTHSDHSDHTDHTDHGDSGPHTDHTDHEDVAGSPHVDHSDHVDHTDSPAHGDSPGHADHSDHTDHSDHGDSGAHTDHDDHADGTPHSDIDADSRPVVV